MRVAVAVSLFLAAGVAMADEPRPKVAVVAIELEGDARPELRDQIGKSLAGGLALAGFEVVAWADVMTAIKDIPELSGCATTSCLERIGELVGADRFVKVHVTAEGAAYVIDLELLGTDPTSNPLARTGGDCGVCTVDEANELVSKLASELKEGGPPPTTAMVRIVSDPPGATIVVDGEPVGSAPLELELVAGDHHIEARLDGYTPGYQDENVIASVDGEVVIALAPHELTGGPRRPYRTIKWVAAGASVALLATGIVLLALDGSCAEDTPGICPDVYDTALGGVVVLGLGVGAGVAAGWLFVKDKPSEEPLPVTRKQVTIGPSGASFTWRF